MLRHFDTICKNHEEVFDIEMLLTDYYLNASFHQKTSLLFPFEVGCEVSSRSSDIRPDEWTK